MIAFPALTQALQDRRLRPSDFRVFGVCLERLDFMEFRPLKAKTVADKLTSRRSRMRESHVAAALRILCRLGYLERGRLEGHTWTYRLRYSLASTCHKSDTIQAA